MVYRNTFKITYIKFIIIVSYTLPTSDNEHKEIAQFS